LSKPDLPRHAQEILEFLRKEKKPYGAKELAEKLGKNDSVVRQRLWLLKRVGLVVHVGTERARHGKNRGRWAIAPNV
jgi:DNA-binding IclR family transcriptional regulator